MRLLRIETTPDTLWAVIEACNEAGLSWTKAGEWVIVEFEDGVQAYRLGGLTGVKLIESESRDAVQAVRGIRIREDA